MKIEKKELGKLNAELVLTIEKSDYIGEFEKELRKIQKDAQMKGFRKGKTPMGIIKKMYGSATLQESVSRLVSKHLDQYIVDEKLDLIGEPIISKENALPELNHQNLDDFTYTFEIGIQPDFEVMGANESDVYEKLILDISGKMIDEELDGIRKKMGERKSVDDGLASGDVLSISAKELDGSDVKENGHETEFSISFDRVDSIRNEIKDFKKGDSFDFDIYTLEKDLPRESVVKYLLKPGEDTDPDTINSTFRGEITDVVRVFDAELNQDLFDRYFGKDIVKSEDEAREKIKGYLGDYYTNESVNLLNRSIMEKLMDTNTVELPENFIKKWISYADDKDLTEEDNEKLNNFKKELKWRIIKNKLIKRFNVEIKEDEILRHFVKLVQQYSPYAGEDTIRSTVMNLMKNKEQVNRAVEQISSEKVFDAIRGVVQIEEKSVGEDVFFEKVREVNAKAQQ